MSVAVALGLGLLAADASALALGQLKIQSHLGEPLRAEIEVTEINPDEADGLRIGMASPAAFSAAGVAYHPALSDVRVNLQRRADGRYVVRLNGNRSLAEPFLDVLLEATWKSGRMVRDYTVLLDPPASPRSQVAAAPIAPQISAPTPAPRASTAPRAARAESNAPAAPVAPVEAPAARTARPAPTPAPSEAPVRTDAAGGEQVTVQRGDTAGKLAAAHKPAEVSLDQMLVAMLRANPQAFIGGNVNRIRAGAVLSMPSAAQASSVTTDEARRTVVAQSQDFNQYRQRLAEQAPTSQVESADRQAGGKLQAQVQDKNASASPDKLTITPGSGAARAADDKLVANRQASDDSARVAELNRNLNELNKLQAASGAPAAAPAAAGAPAAPGITVPVTPPGAAAPAAAPSTPAAAAPAPAVAANAPAGAPSATPAAPAAPAAADAAGTGTAAAPAAGAAAPAEAPAASAPPAPAPAPKPRPKVAPPPPPPPPSFFDELLGNPMVLGGLGLIALLAGYLGWRSYSRRRALAAGDSIFLESRIPKDSFFGSSGGESVDTRNQSLSGNSSLSYSPSQLDAGDVDPVAEADVYLAYGRDLQAEEILREALRLNPERTAIHLKLLEIHAKRRDLRAYEQLATEVHRLTGGTGSEWGRVVELGRDLDPGNPLYQSAAKAAPAPAPAAATAPAPLGMPAAAAATAAMAAPIAASLPPLPPIEEEEEAPPPAFVPSVAPLDFDLELDKPSTAPAPVATAPAPITASLPPLDLPPAAAKTLAALDARSLDLENDFDTAPAALEPTPRRAPRMADDEEHTQPATLRAGLPGDSGYVEFEMSRSGGLGSHTSPARLEPSDDLGENPHAIKLTLARELHALGDAEGARSLVEEVAAETSGELRAQAQELLGQLR